MRFTWNDYENAAPPSIAGDARSEGRRDGRQVDDSTASCECFLCHLQKFLNDLRPLLIAQTGDA
ncbi:MAG TPA: hypothetical protein VK025_07040, partial [Steroidobacter sp.]|nr:hypothetical protein [Steroidobacter sp.]